VIGEKWRWVWDFGWWVMGGVFELFGSCILTLHIFPSRQDD